MKGILLFCFVIGTFVSCTKELVYDGNHLSEWESYTVNLTQAGTLKDLLPQNYLEIKSLNVVGPINGSDLKLIRCMCGADEYGNETEGGTEQLNLEQAVFVEGGEPYFYYDGEPVLQRNQVLSSYAFGYCKKLKEILLPENLEAVGSQAFPHASFCCLFGTWAGSVIMAGGKLAGTSTHKQQRSMPKFCDSAQMSLLFNLKSFFVVKCGFSEYNRKHY